MADVNADIIINVDTSIGISEIKNLQRAISQLNTQLIQSGAQQAKAAQNVQRNLINNINATGKFAANVRTISTTAESFTTALEKNKLSMGEYFRYAGASTKTFGRLFKNEFGTIEKVARERVKTLQTQYIKLGRDANGAMKAISVRPLALDMDDLATKTAMAAQKQQLFNQLMKQGSTNLLNFGKNTQWAGRQLMVGFSIPLAYLGSIASKTFMEMEEQALKFKRVYGELFTTQAETDAMVAKIQELSKEFTKYGVTAAKTMEMAAEAAAMGKMGADLLSQVTESTRLAVLGNVEASQALETTISVTNAFGIAAEKLAGKIDFLNAVENQTVTSIEDLTIAIPKAAPVIKQLGGDVEDLSFFLTAMKEGGINASEGANALKSGLASLINPTAKASDFLAKFGVNVNGIVEANKGNVKGLVVDFAKALDTLDPLNRARAIEQMFGKFQFSRLSTLFQNVIAEGSQAQRVLKLTNATTEELAILSERELKRVEDSPMYKFKKAVEDLKVSLVPLGEAFLKAVTPLVEFAKGFLERFNEMGDGAKQFAVIATTVVAGIGPVLLMTFGLVANGVANLIKMFTAIGSIFNRTGKGTQDLALQTEYMTQQQLEAAAVASSLDQSHIKLSQTFTAEASAVNALATAYGKAVLAQERLLGLGGAVPGARGARGARGAKSPAPKKYNRGVVSVPGPKGAGDVVPAMLSPGEAIIPAKQSQKYAGLVQAMITDSVPGFRIGRNPFASMLGRSRVAVRTKQEDLINMVQGGKNARYKNAFETKTGADYVGVGGIPNPAQKKLREQMEAKVLGLGKDTPASSRPTYGYARTSPLQALINRIFGFKGKQYNSVTSGKQIGGSSDTLKRYGDIDLITKRSVGKRSSAAVTDALMDYERSGQYPGFRLSPVSMRGKGNFKDAKFDRLSNPFGQYQTDPKNNPRQYTANPKPPYVETYTPGGFKVSEISRIVAKDRATAKALQKVVDQAGLRIKVTPQNAPKVIKALSGIFGTRFSKGTTGAEYKFDPNEGRVQTHLQDPSKLFDDGSSTYNRSLAESFEKARPGSSDLSKSVSEKFRVLGELTANLPRTLNENLKRPNGVSISEFEKAWNATPDKLDATIKRGISDLGIKIPKGQLADEIAKIEKEILNQVKKVSVNGRVNDSILSGATKNALGKFKDSSVAKILQARAGTLREYRTTYDKDGLIKDIKNGTLELQLNKNGSANIVDKKSGLVVGRLNNTAGMTRQQQMEKYLSLDKKGREKFLDQMGLRSDSKFVRQSTNGMSVTTTSPKPPKKTPAEKIKPERAIPRPTSKPQAQNMTDVLSRASGYGKPVAATQKPKRARRFGRWTLPGFANGIVSVPGPKGKGDVVPAMLSPGEAIIPAKLSEKYAPLISGMVSDSIPGYEYGLIPGFGANGLPLGPDGKPQQQFSAPQDSGSARSGVLSSAKNWAKTAGSQLATSGKDFGKTAWSGIKKGASAAAERTVGVGLSHLSGIPLAMANGNTYDPATGTVTDASGRVVGGGATAGTDKRGRTYYTDSATGKRISKDDYDSRNTTLSNARTANAQTKKQQFAQGAQRAGMVGMGLSMASSAAMMLPGEAGKVAGDIAPLMIGLSTLAMFIQGPTTAALVALVAAVGLPLYAMFKANEAFNEAQKNAMSLADALGTGDKAMQKFADFAGNVSANEIMDKRRSEKLGIFQIKTGKTTFGQSFMQGEEGQSLLQNTTKSIETGGRAQGIASLKAQMASAVASGSLDSAQARSIVAQLAEQLGDYSLGMQVNAELISLLGPNGENLAKDPLQVRVKMLEESQGRAKAAMDNANKLAGDDFLGLSGNAWATGIGGALAGSGVGAAIGAAIGTAILPGIGTGVGAVIGTGIGLISGGITGFIAGNEEHQNDVAEASGASVALQQMALEQQQQMSDSLEVEYEQRIKAAEAAGDLVEKEKLLKELQDGRVKILEENKDLNQQIMSSYSNAQDQDLKTALMSGADTAIEARYKEGPMAAVAKLASSRIGESGLAEEKQYLLKMQVASGEIDPIQMLNILSMPSGSQERVINIIGKYGGAFTSQVSALTGMFVDKDGKPIESIQTEFLAKIDTAKTPEEAQKILDFYQKVAQSGAVLDTAITVDFLMKNPTKAKKLQETFDEIDAMKGPITVEVLAKVLGKKEIEAINDDLTYFNGLTDEEKKIYTQVLAQTISTVSPDDPALKNWLGAEGSAWKNSPPGTQLREYAQWNARTVTETSVDTTTGNEPPADPKGGGGKAEDPYEDTLKRLKEVREAAVNTSGGLKELGKWLGGNKNMKQFVGMEQQLMKKGANRGFIDYVLGLDKDVQKKFVTIKNGILTITAAGKSMAKAFNEIALGEFQVSLRQSAIDANNQSIAFRKLTSAGMSVAEAIKAIEDPALAAAVASKSISSQELKTMAKEANATANALATVAAKLQLIQDMKDEAGKTEVQDRFRTNNTKFNEIEQFAIESDGTLLETYSKFLSGEIKSLPKEFSDRLAQLTNSIDLKQAFFEDGFSKAMEAFQAQEESLKIKMELDLEDFEIPGLDKKLADGARSIIANAQNEIAGLQYKIDDYQAGIQEIEWQEETINEKYDKRFEALDKIEKANSKIAAQQKNQLTLADALSQGDIAAAARAAQDMRAKSAEDAVSSQRDTLEASKQKEIEALKSGSGLTRKQINAAILDIEKQIFAIEESRLEPAQEAVRKAEAKLAADTASLTVAGNTKLQWDAIKNSIDVAKTSSAAYDTAIAAALTTVTSIKGYWDGLDGRTITTTHKIVTVNVGSNGIGEDVEVKDDGNPDGKNDGKNDGKKDPVTVSDAVKSATAFAKSGMSVSGYINKLDSKTTSAKQAADQKASATAFKASGQSVSAYINKVDSQAAAKTTKAVQTAFGLNNFKAGAPTYASLAPKTLVPGTGKYNGSTFVPAQYKSGGGMIMPNYMASGGMARGTDTVPAMLTPGEFVVKKYAVADFGADKLKAINSGTYSGDSVYNYELNVSMSGSSLSADDVARTVMAQIKQVDSQRLRGNNF